MWSPSQLRELIFLGSFLLRYAAPKIFTLKSYLLKALTSSSMEHSDQLQGKTNKASYSHTVDLASADVFKNANRLVLRQYILFILCLPSLGLGLSFYPIAQFRSRFSVYTYSIFGPTRASRNEWPPLDTLIFIRVISPHYIQRNTSETLNNTAMDITGNPQQSLTGPTLSDNSDQFASLRGTEVGLWASASVDTFNLKASRIARVWLSF